MAKPAAVAVGVTMLMIIAVPALARRPPNRGYPDTADRTTLITLRDAVRQDAARTLQRIGACERSVADPYGTDRVAFNQCILTRLSEDMYTSRFEPAMLVGVLRDLARGPCLGLTSGLTDAISELGSEAETWIGDAENPDPSAAALERADSHDMRTIAGDAVTLASARGWRTACPARPYQPSEHHLGVHLHHVRSYLLVS